MSLHVGSVWRNETGWSFLEPSQFEAGTTEGDNKSNRELEPAEISHAKDFTDSDSLVASLLQLIVRHYCPSTGTEQLIQISLHQPLA